VCQPVWKSLNRAGRHGKMTVQCPPVWKTIKTRQLAHYSAYCDSFLWLDPCTLFAFHTDSLASFTFHTGLLPLFAFHTGSLATFTFHTGRRAIVASKTHYLAESGLKNPKNF
jgi:hypothetical protein